MKDKCDLIRQYILAKHLKHVTPPVIFVLEEKMREQQKEIDSLKAQLVKRDKKLAEAVDLLDDAYDTYNVEEIGEFLMSLEEKEDE